jgi:predicted adenylyl cyclase CyaB
MKEIEIQILEVNQKKIISKLKKLGAKKVFDDEIIGIKFYLPKNLEKKISLLGLRKKGKHTFVVMKGKQQKSKAKIREETETKIEDYPKMKKIFETLGFKSSKEAKKHRISYVLGKTNFEINIIKEIPPYLEIEAPTMLELKKAVSLMGYSIDDAKAWTLRDFKKHYGVKN